MKTVTVGDLREGYRFPSRRNTVTLVRIGEQWAVRKVFASAESLTEEMTRMEEARRKGLRVPALLRRDKKTIYYAYINGTTALSYLESGGSDPAVWNAFADWIADFYLAIGYLMRDCQLRNYIFSLPAYRVTGFDFEGEVLRDAASAVGRLLAYVRTYDLADARAGESLPDLLRERFLDRLAGAGLTAEQLSSAEQEQLAVLLAERQKKR